MIAPALSPTRVASTAAFADAEFLQTHFSTSIVENVNVWLNVLDNDLNIVLWNATAEKLSGYARHEVLGHSRIWEWLYPDDEYRRSITERVLAMLVSDQALENLETKIRCRNGMTRVILWNSQSLTDETGRVYGVITFGYDVTDLERARAALQKAHNDLSVLYDVVSVVSDSMDLATILHRSLERVLFAMSCAKGAVHLLEDGATHLRLAAQQGLTPGVAAQLNDVGMDDDLIGRVASLAEPLMVPDLGQEVAGLKAIPANLLHSYLGVPLRARGTVVGVFSILGKAGRHFRQEEIALLSSIADQVGIAVENARLYQQARQLAVMEERRRLARDLHDSVTQTLYSLTLFAETGRRFVQRGELETAEANLNRLIETAQRALKEMRLLVYELRPLGLEADGLVMTLQKRLDAVERRAGVKAVLTADDLPGLPNAVERDLYHILQEALNNALKYAGATAVTVEIRGEDGQIQAAVTDNGAGFDVAAARQRGGLGLTSMQERAERLGGKLAIASQPGAFTTVAVTFPLPAATPVASGAIWAQPQESAEDRP